ncbi:Bifunctional thiamine biosynthesis protein ThiDN [Candidatus Gugararchaeum adminiculabundum]|nr:Bifunctional thiamine biosynthesis protein ThiDN [Candidatus Gugararchaeum adminiculabundum]
MAKKILLIGGNDPDGCAGLAADLKTCAAFGAHGAPIVTAVTVQNTRKTFSANPVSGKLISQQIHAVCSDMKFDCVKIGLLAGAESVRAVFSSLPKSIPIILDPVLTAQPDKRALASSGVLPALKNKSILKRITLITPNMHEASKLSGTKITGLSSAKIACKKLRALGAKNILIKGMEEAGGNNFCDILFLSKDNSFTLFIHKKISKGTHGGGCVFASSIACFITRGLPLEQAVSKAEEFTYASIHNAQKIGKGKECVSISIPTQ